MNIKQPNLLMKLNTLTRVRHHHVRVTYYITVSQQVKDEMVYGVGPRGISLLNILHNQATATPSDTCSEILKIAKDDFVRLIKDYKSFLSKLFLMNHCNDLQDVTLIFV